ncbi:MAG: hypothetical protein GDA56_26000 [Hormoscilla sp. GM7CHS1pb]|nr:hypothetical protein [Hormoscilla sp. GM7CHS1pb]
MHSGNRVFASRDERGLFSGKYFACVRFFDSGAIAFTCQELISTIARFHTRHTLRGTRFAALQQRQTNIGV